MFRKIRLLFIILLIAVGSVISIKAQDQGCPAYFYVDQSKPAEGGYPPGVFDSSFHGNGKGGQNGISVAGKLTNTGCEKVLFVEYAGTSPNINPNVYKLTQMPGDFTTGYNGKTLTVWVYEVSRWDGEKIVRPFAVSIQEASDDSDGVYGIVPYVDGHSYDFLNPTPIVMPTVHIPEFSTIEPTEMATQTQILPPLPSNVEIDKQPVTEAQFAVFTQSSQYQDRSFWVDDIPHMEGYDYYQVIRTDSADPKDADYFEAEAYCRYIGARLPTYEELMQDSENLVKPTDVGAVEWTSSKIGDKYELVYWTQQGPYQLKNAYSPFGGTYFRCAKQVF